MRNYISPNKTASVVREGGGTYVGVITSQTSEGIFVEIPGIAPGQSFGPCLIASPGIKLELEKTTVTTPTGTTQAVTDVVISTTTAEVEVVVGSKVFCTFLNNGLNEVIVIGSVS